ncbi:MAG: hypothetical protein ABI768_03835 [Acidobacteriota bacterium]
MSWKLILLNWRGLVFVALGMAGIWVGLQAAEYRFFGVLLAMFSFFLAASFLGKAGRLAAALRPLVGRTVRVEIWGMPPPGAGDGVFDVNTITGIGAGLLFHFLPDSDGPGAVLKVAQPGSQRLADTRVTIGTAAYVSWAGKKVSPPTGTKAPPLVLSVP